jgi:hypothetical protein
VSNNPEIVVTFTEDEVVTLFDVLDYLLKLKTVQIQTATRSDLGGIKEKLVEASQLTRGEYIVAT